MKSRFGYRTQIPSTSTQKGSTQAVSFKDGVDTYKDNDDLKPTELRAAIDARFTKIGRYKTRRGLDRYSVPVGEAVNAQNSSTTGAGVATISATQALAQPLTLTGTQRLSQVEVRIRTTATSKGVVLVEVRQNNAGVPGALLARSSIRPADIGSSFAYKPVYFAAAPEVTGTPFVVIKTQSKYAGVYEVSTTTTGSTGLISNDAGFTWTGGAVNALNVKLYTAPYNPVLGLIRVNRPNGQRLTVFGAGGVIYQVDDTTGATTVVKSGLSASATFYRFEMVQDAIYWINGQEKPYKWDSTTVTQLTACPFIPDELSEHKGLIFFSDSSDFTKFAWTNFGEYDKFTSTDFQYAPAPKTADGITAFQKLNGILYILTHNNKFAFMGDDNVTFRMDEAAPQRGTFTQETTVSDANFIYHADFEGIWQFNGSEEVNLAKPFLEDYLAIPNKNTMQLDIYKNRLYVFYAPSGSADNTECYVINLQLKKLESLDKGAYVGRTYGRGTQDDLFLQASNRVAAVYYAELPTNDYHNLGDQIQYDLLTGASHFDQPAALKRIPKWRPTFAAANADYDVRCGYATDLSLDFNWQDVPMSGSGPRFNNGVLFNSGVRFGGVGIIEPDLYLSGEFKRAQRRYQHIAAREPVEFDSEVLMVETQRIR
ncbi:hypothetical protein [Arthrobacter cavernae]|uniref:Uncharacterized protein n=1 Tax=Arthrobacter cavernae TaxID=2817681 RepID=A0A939KMX8_9MICC|nr:hypothetical protein [Arthrobacter cavernae]MBO1267090.1 hypothetical protein [Arthrobacter cavernae]